MRAGRAPSSSHGSPLNSHRMFSRLNTRCRRRMNRRRTYPGEGHLHLLIILRRNPSAIEDPPCLPLQREQFAPQCSSMSPEEHVARGSFRDDVQGASGGVIAGSCSRRTQRRRVNACQNNRAEPAGPQAKAVLAFAGRSNSISLLPAVVDRRSATSVCTGDEGGTQRDSPARSRPSSSPSTTTL